MTGAREAVDVRSGWDVYRTGVIGWTLGLARQYGERPPGWRVWRIWTDAIRVNTCVLFARSLITEAGPILDAAQNAFEESAYERGVAAERLAWQQRVTDAETALRIYDEGGSSEYWERWDHLPRPETAAVAK